MLKIFTNHQFAVLALSVCTAFASTGCRSGMPKMNMFGFKREPSPETLAGAGPSTTYPLPPSTSVSPQAIASVAGGTAPSKPAATSQIASSLGQPSVTPTAKTAAPTTNYAAAQANGVYAPPGMPKTTTAQPVGYNTPTYAQASTSTVKPSSTATNTPTYTPPTSTSSATAGTTSPQPSGYVFGQKATAPTSAPSTTPAMTPSSFSLPSTSTTATATATASAPTSSGGFSMPPGILPTAPAPTSTVTAGPTATTSTATAAIAPPAATAPAYSTASQPNTAPATSVYTPGSTSGATSYPAGGYSAPSSSGSIYR